MFPLRQKDGLLCLHENGAVSVRCRSGFQVDMASSTGIDSNILKSPQSDTLMLEFDKLHIIVEICSLLKQTWTLASAIKK